MSKRDSRAQISNTIQALVKEIAINAIDVITLTLSTKLTNLLISQSTPQSVIRIHQPTKRPRNRSTTSGPIRDRSRVERGRRQQVPCRGRLRARLRQRHRRPLPRINVHSGDLLALQGELLLYFQWRGGEEKWYSSCVLDDLAQDMLLAGGMDASFRNRSSVGGREDEESPLHYYCG